MMLELALSPQAQVVNRKVPHFLPDIYEVVAFCPGCKTLETLYLNNGLLMQTRKFNQQGEQVFHSCDTPEPCRLYRIC